MPSDIFLALNHTGHLSIPSTFPRTRFEGYQCTFQERTFLFVAAYDVRIVAYKQQLRVGSTILALSTIFETLVIQVRDPNYLLHGFSVN